MRSVPVIAASDDVSDVEVRMLYVGRLHNGKLAVFLGLGPSRIAETVTPRMMRRVCLLALCTAVRATPSGAQLDDLGAPLLTIPLHKGGEEYALLDFFSGDPAHIETTAHQFCFDHSFSAEDKAMIIEHATKQMAMVQSQRAQLPQVNGVSGQGPAPANKPTSNVHKLVMFMTQNKMSPADVLRALADTL